MRVVCVTWPLLRCGGEHSAVAAFCTWNGEGGSAILSFVSDNKMTWVFFAISLSIGLPDKNSTSPSGRWVEAQTNLGKIWELRVIASATQRRLTEVHEPE